METKLSSVPSPADSQRALGAVASRMVPRLLTQVCRDPTSPMFGCFDRNWWHYKIRDFPSIILQQGAYALHLASRLAPWKADAEALSQIARGACAFWNDRAEKWGAFEEYYPWEQGYPPLAFGTLAIQKLLLAGVITPGTIASGTRRAALQLKNRFESQASNQQVAGLAAMAAIRKSFPEFISQDEFDQLSSRTMALQHAEGWFLEYGGPDLGYLTVTMDCLWDLYDLTGNPGYIEAAARGLRFIANFSDADRCAAGMHNARNTDYLVPYGIFRFASSGGPHRELALTVLCRLYSDADAPTHFFACIDDRYVSHYICHSVLRALDTAIPDSHVSAPATADRPESLFLEGSGHVIRRPRATRCGAIISLRKGGILTVFDGKDCRASDFGWVASVGGGQFVTHWWSPDWVIQQEGPDCFQVSGSLFPHKEQISRPWKHALLRGASLLLGRHLIARLKKLVIFKKRASSIRFTRCIELTASGATVEDRFSGLTPDIVVRPAPRASKRHVASSDSFHAEDLALMRGFTCERSESREGVTLTIRSSYAIHPTVVRVAKQEPPPAI